MTEMGLFMITEDRLGTKFPRAANHANGVRTAVKEITNEDETVTRTVSQAEQLIQLVQATVRVAHNDDAR